ncbi:MAG: hypothetical protein HY873_06060 [Chloroflexi bacterium]|nr:hypothetical protein [Chloroflexota bacterium]
MRELVADLRRRKPAPSQYRKPTWQMASGFDPDGQSLARRRASLTRLVCITLLWFRAELGLDDGGGFAPEADLDKLFGPDTSAKDREDLPLRADPRPSPYMEAGGSAGPRKLARLVAARPLGLLHDPDAARDEAWEPAGELARVLEIPESKLNGFLRETSGHSAREWWDILRAEVIRDRIRAEVFQRLLDECFHRTERGIDKILRVRLTVELLLNRLRKLRRAAGWSRKSCAWGWGFKNASRMERAVYAVTGQTLFEIEVEAIREIDAKWVYNPVTCTIYPEDRELTPDVLEAHRASFLRFASTHNRGYRDGAWVPKPTKNEHLPEDGAFQNFDSWSAFEAYCKEHRFDVRKVIRRNFDGRWDAQCMLKHLGLYSPACDEFKDFDFVAEE